MRVLLHVLLLAVFAAALSDRIAGADGPTAENRVTVALPPHAFATALLPASPFGINTALRPDAPDLEERLEAMQRAGIRSVPVDPVRTKHLPVPLGERPVYVIGARGMRATARPDPGW